MAVEKIEEYRQKNGDEILKPILKPTQKFPKGFFYCDVSDEKLVRQYTWGLLSQKYPYVVTCIYSHCSQQHLRFHREKKHNLLGNYPDCINHVNGIEFDNININLDKVTSQQNNWCKPSKGYLTAGQSFEPKIMVNYQQIWDKCVKTEVEACISAYQLEVTYEDYHYNFLKDRRNDLDILDMERTGKISEEEAVYRHVLRYADNAWYYYRYSLAEYFREYHISVPVFCTDIDGFMTHPITGQRLCPL